ncbi:MAG TPA: protein-L-isoaspartate(D-aspartate) O-methyltransferase [Polyangiaceae bacterium]|jgi:protein-L-isoaspartate(D-aspartate) O-methyltransferase|nr:protein-L-isoaspartate(D-aspartate) O-methyltransferase [Polyangiaceae bacterium]
MHSTQEPSDFGQARAQMVERQLRAHGILDYRVLDAMAKVPRHEFVPPAQRRFAYADRPVPIGSGQTISQPRMVATLLEALELRGDEKVLDVGTGSGYQAALLSALVRKVISIELLPELAAAAEKTLKRLGHASVRVVLGDGSVGWPADAPYDRIVVAAGSPGVPAPLLDQLADRGRLVIPVGKPSGQRLLRVRKHDTVLKTERLMWCQFVPLVGRAGWSGNTRGSVAHSSPTR